MSPGVPIRTSFLPVSSCRKSCAGAGPRFEDMVRYMESASEGLAHHFAVEDDELRLKTNIRGGPLPATATSMVIPCSSIWRAAGPSAASYTR